MKRAFIYISLIAALPFISGCEGEFSWSGAGARTPITFSANSYYENGPVTKTAYSNEFFGTNPQYERIDWVADDLIRISETDGTSNASASYKIVGSTIVASSKNSNATVSLASGSSELQWLSDATHTFYAFYGNNAASSTGNSIVATLPEAQNGTRVGTTNEYKPNMNYAYMWAATSTAPTSEGVSLEFSPLMTAFEVTVGAEGTSTLNIKSFTLESSSMIISGSYTATINSNLQGYTLSNISGTKKITVSFGSAGVDVTHGNPATFTVFAIPQTGLTDLKMTFTLADGSKTIPLNYNGSPYTFAPGKKYQITNVYVPEPENWEYTIDQINNITTYGHNPVSGLSFTVNSYKYSNLQPTHVPVSWTAEVISVTNAVAGDLDAQSWSGNGNSNAKTVAIINPSSNEYPDDPSADAGAAAAAKLASNPYRGSTATEPWTYWDLSRHKFYGTEADMTATIAQETANCYVVSSPGVYKFPLVYGNAITAGGTNTSAYNPGGTASSTWLANFQNYAGNGISSPYILSDIGQAVSAMEAVVVWQDVPEEKIILRTGNYGVGGTSASDAFIWFKIDKDDIKQGNIVLALRRKSDKVIVWSWHIWITEKVDESDYVIPVESPNTTNLKMMKYNLGWTDASNATGYAYPTRIWTIKVTLTENPSVSRTFTIKQVGDAKEVPANIGTNTFYQWGRKDPELPARNSLQNKQFYSNDGYNPDGGMDGGEYILHRSGPTSMNIPNTIQNPDIHYYANNANPKWTTLINLWDSNISSSESDEYVDKTVYDPCPPGFTVPRRNAFMVFTNVNGTWETGNTYRPANGQTTNGLGITFWTRRNKQGPRIFFPATGARREKSNFQAIFELGYYWTASTISNGSKARSLQFFVTGDLSGMVYAIYDQWHSAAYTIRPCTEE